ncbi:ADP-ribosylation_factor [Hexamita inflata]|uniref:ADP-ribosylation factor n=1 Tax=Hexamita inflata TaxID=28002 RepID=A0AA86PDL0_9EUKA|nr:ADP-ribosylation factor [Hexamita inflata]CAI9950332.1 ADP-ribosylation factor [Hexamita inflata]CAI9950346.1 ADP-ribosylation factor [Hexamita inflata]CAI9964289.1 ADP-ribosylation factor [Hexamita inflata]
MSLCIKCKKDTEVHVVMLGLAGSGKTSLLYQWKLNELIDTIPTIGFNVETIKRKKQSLTLWDVGGQDQIIRLWKHYLFGATVLFYVIDSTERDFQRIHLTKMELIKLMSNDDLTKVPFIILFNKSDKPNSFTDEELEDEYSFNIGETELNINSIHKINVMRISALDPQNFTKILDWIELIQKKK